MRRIFIALTISLSLFGLIVLYEYLSGSVISSNSIKKDLLWGLITGFGIEYVFPIFQKWLNKRKR